MPSHLNWSSLVKRSREFRSSSKLSIWTLLHFRARRTALLFPSTDPAYKILNHHPATKCCLQNQIFWVHIAHCTVSRKIDLYWNSWKTMQQADWHVSPDQSQLLDLTGEFGWQTTQWGSQRIKTLDARISTNQPVQVCDFVLSGACQFSIDAPELSVL